MVYPTLCHNEHLEPYGGCRICLVEVATVQAPDRARLLPACSTATEEGMVVFTDSPRVIDARRFIVELFLARCPGVPEIMSLAEELGAAPQSPGLDVVGEYLLKRAPRRDETKCILCSLCVRSCAYVCPTNAITVEEAT